MILYISVAAGDGELGVGADGMCSYGVLRCCFRGWVEVGLYYWVIMSELLLCGLRLVSMKIWKALLTVF